MTSKKVTSALLYTSTVSGFLISSPVQACLYLGAGTADAVASRQAPRGRGGTAASPPPRAGAVPKSAVYGRKRFEAKLANIANLAK